MKNLLKSLWLIGALCLLSFQSQAQFEGIRISPDAKISLITCSPGAELYSVFGHSAVRVQDPALGLDVIFNYGTFDFNEPNFYLKFIQGKLNYKLSAAHFQDFVYNYEMDNRSIYEQELNLTPEQNQQYWLFLTNNYLPANRFYLYDFFFDNCATRIRDGLEKTFPNEVKFNISQLDKDLSFRNLIDLYLPPQPWGDFGIDLALGARIDREATPYEYMFLPDYLSKGFANATLTQNSKATPLTKGQKVIFERDPNQTPPAGFFTPAVALWLFFAIALALTILDYTRKQRSRGFDLGLFLVTGLLGVLLFLLWVGTDHQATANNFNLLWALPTHVIVAFYLRKQTLPAWVTKYLLVSATVCAILLAAWPWWPQQFHVAFIPLVLTLGMRAAYTVWLSKQQPVQQIQKQRT
ncbi:Lnb N-terminal periplasmic domain-containing protein [Pontibacter vulgaris]|uniref:Lnb N-terminal periplasmic domain-containing protein n=1 Tax=Pontibacter vulgaris TaxID=2905679 RepID=UPI001FA78097|nr:DUF4105 domain-containing protein [Pontibacter vulgaris]